MKKWKRTAAAIFAAAILCGALPVHTPVQDLFSSVVLTAHAAVTAAGFCGDTDVNDGKDVKWKLEDGVLTISGNGVMEDYPEDYPGWNSYRESIKSAVIEDGVKSIGEYAFYECVNMSSVTIADSVTGIGEGAFSYCSNLTSVIIPDSVKTIGESAFYRCISLSSVTISKNIEIIDKYLFEDCSSLEAVILKSETPPILLSSALYDTSSYLTFYVPEASVDAYKNAWSEYADRIKADISYEWNCGAAGDNCKATLTADGTLTISGTGAMADFYPNVPGWYQDCLSVSRVVIEDGVTSIGDFAFQDCEHLTSAAIADSVTSIGEYAFSNCIELTSVTIPDSLKSIGEYAFYFCIYLTSVTLPESVTSIGSNAFEMCIVLDSMIMKGETPPELGYDVFSDTSDDLQITVPSTAMDAYKTAWSDYADRIIMGMPYRWNCGADGDNCKATLTADGTLTISGTGAMEDYPIEYPGWNDDRDSVTNVVIENGVTSIGAYVFAGCSKMTTVTIPDSVTSIGESAFYNCSSLTDVTIPDGVTSIGESAFNSCTSLTDVTIPDGVTSIGDGAFYYCSSLTAVSIPNGVTSIGEYAFKYCAGLTSVTIPNGVTSIGESAFYKCSSLTDVTIPDGVTSIGESTFERCSSLTDVTIPDSVTSIGAGAFYNCGSLKSVIMKGETPSGLADYVFSGAHDDLKIRVPAPSGDAYKNAWSDYADKIVEYTALKEEACYPVKTASANKVRVGFSVNVPKGKDVVDYGLIYYNSGNVIHTEHLTLENVGICGIKKAKYYNANITDLGYGVTAVGYVQVKNADNTSEIYYTGELGGSFEAMTNAAKYVKLTKQENKAVTSGGKQKVYVGFDANVPNCYTVSDYGLIYYNSGTVITTPYLTLENVGICGINKAKYWGANITDNGYGVTAVGFVKIKDALGNETVIYSEELGGSFKAISEAAAANAVTLTRQANKAIISGGKQKVYVGFNANVAEDYTVKDYGLIYYNSGTVITTPYLTLENVGVCGISKAKYWGANITDIGYGVTAVGFVTVEDANGCVTTLYTEELGGSFTAISEAAAANAVTLTRQANKAIVSGGKNKVYVGFNASVADGYTVEDYGLIYYNSGTVITTPYLTLENVGICGISKAKYWGANITDNGYGVTAVGFVKVKDANGYVTTLYTGELGAKFANLT